MIPVARSIENQIDVINSNNREIELNVTQHNQSDSFRYYKLCQLADTSNSSNGELIHISGTLGGFLSGTVCWLDFYVHTRDNIDAKGYYYGYDEAFKFGYFVLYQNTAETDRPYSLYLVVTHPDYTYYVGNINLKLLKSSKLTSNGHIIITADADTFTTTTPTGTLSLTIDNTTLAKIDSNLLNNISIENS